MRGYLITKMVNGMMAVQRAALYTGKPRLLDESPGLGDSEDKVWWKFTGELRITALFGIVGST
jgi:hypothetical protein